MSDIPEGFLIAYFLGSYNHQILPMTESAILLFTDLEADKQLKVLPRKYKTRWRVAVSEAEKLRANLQASPSEQLPPARLVDLVLGKKINAREEQDSDASTASADLVVPVLSVAHEETLPPPKACLLPESEQPTKTLTEVSEANDAKPTTSPCNDAKPTTTPCPVSEQPDKTLAPIINPLCSPSIQEQHITDMEIGLTSFEGLNMDFSSMDNMQLEGVMDSTSHSAFLFSADLNSVDVPETNLEMDFEGCCSPEIAVSEETVSTDNLPSEAFPILANDLPALDFLPIRPGPVQGLMRLRMLGREKERSEESDEALKKEVQSVLEHMVSSVSKEESCLSAQLTMELPSSPKSTNKRKQKGRPLKVQPQASHPTDTFSDASGRSSADGIPNRPNTRLGGKRPRPKKRCAPNRDNSSSEERDGPPRVKKPKFTVTAKATAMYTPATISRRTPKDTDAEFDEQFLFESYDSEGMDSKMELSLDEMLEGGMRAFFKTYNSVGSSDWTSFVKACCQLETNRGPQIKSCIMKAIELAPSEDIKTDLRSCLVEPLYQINGAGRARTAALLIVEKYSGQKIINDRSRRQFEKWLATHKLPMFQDVSNTEDFQKVTIKQLLEKSIVEFGSEWTIQKSENDASFSTPLNMNHDGTVLWREQNMALADVVGEVLGISSRPINSSLVFEVVRWRGRPLAHYCRLYLFPQNSSDIDAFVGAPKATLNKATVVTPDRSPSRDEDGGDTLPAMQAVTSTCVVVGHGEKGSRLSSDGAAQTQGSFQKATYRSARIASRMAEAKAQEERERKQQELVRQKEEQKIQARAEKARLSTPQVHVVAQMSINPNATPTAAKALQHGQAAALLPGYQGPSMMPTSLKSGTTVEASKSREILKGSSLLPFGTVKQEDGKTCPGINSAIEMQNGSAMSQSAADSLGKRQQRSCEPDIKSNYTMARKMTALNNSVPDRPPPLRTYPGAPGMSPAPSLLPFSDSLSPISTSYGRVPPTPVSLVPNSLIWDSQRFQYESITEYEAYPVSKDDRLIHLNCANKFECKAGPHRVIQIGQLLQMIASNPEAVDPHILVAPQRYGGIGGRGTQSLHGPQPFAVYVHPEVAFVCDLHTHLASSEVIGLLGGVWDAENHALYIQAAFPCRALDQEDGGLNDVEMEPTSELEVRAAIAYHGWQVVGWYHSHPYFAAAPSLTDIENQANYQFLMRDDEYHIEPFVGLIVSTYDPAAPSSRAQTMFFHVQHRMVEGHPQPVAFPLVLDVKVLSYRWVLSDHSIKELEQDHGRREQQRKNLFRKWQQDFRPKAPAMTQQPPTPKPMTAVPYNPCLSKTVFPRPTLSTPSYSMGFGNSASYARTSMLPSASMGFGYPRNDAMAFKIKKPRQPRITKGVNTCPFKACHRCKGRKQGGWFCRFRKQHRDSSYDTPKRANAWAGPPRFTEFLSSVAACEDAQMRFQTMCYDDWLCWYAQGERPFFDPTTGQPLLPTYSMTMQSNQASQLFKRKPTNRLPVEDAFLDDTPFQFRGVLKPSSQEDEALDKYSWGSSPLFQAAEAYWEQEKLLECLPSSPKSSSVSDEHSPLLGPSALRCMPPLHLTSTTSSDNSTKRGIDEHPLGLRESEEMFQNESDLDDLVPLDTNRKRTSEIQSNVPLLSESMIDADQTLNSEDIEVMNSLDIGRKDSFLDNELLQSWEGIRKSSIDSTSFHLDLDNESDFDIPNRKSEDLGQENEENELTLKNSPITERQRKLSELEIPGDASALDILSAAGSVISPLHPKDVLIPPVIKHMGSEKNQSFNASFQAPTKANAPNTTLKKEESQNSEDFASFGASCLSPHTRKEAQNIFEDAVKLISFKKEVKEPTEITRRSDQGNTFSIYIWQKQSKIDMENLHHFVRPTLESPMLSSSQLWQLLQLYGPNVKYICYSARALVHFYARFSQRVNFKQTWCGKICKGEKFQNSLSVWVAKMEVNPLDHVNFVSDICEYVFTCFSEIRAKKLKKRVGPHDSSLML